MRPSEAQNEAQAIYAQNLALEANIARSELENTARAVQPAAQAVTRMTALLDAEQIRPGGYTFTAPMAETVLTLLVDPGQNVGTSSVLMTPADLVQLEVREDVGEVTQIQLDQ